MESTDRPASSSGPLTVIAVIVVGVACMLAIALGVIVILHAMQAVLAPMFAEPRWPQ